ncbi:substrate-binding periplasmic protein [Pseudomonas borbori]
MRSIFLLLCLLASTSLLAAAPCPQPLRVGISSIGYSYYVQADGTPAGSAFDFYAELSQRSGCTFELSPLPRVRAWHDAELRQLDIISPTIRTAERDKHGYFIEYFRNRNDLIVHRNLSPRIHNIEQLLADPTLKIGLVRGHANGAYFDRRLQALASSPRIELSTEPRNIFLKLQAGRIQATLMTAGLYQKELDDLAMNNQVRIIEVPESDGFAVGLYLSRMTLEQPTIDWLHQHIGAMIADGSLRRLLNRRHGKALTERFYPPQTLNPAAASPG